MIRLLILLPIMMGLAISCIHHEAPVGYTYTVPIIEPSRHEPDWVGEVLLRWCIESLLRDPNKFDPHGIIAKG